MLPVAGCALPLTPVHPPPAPSPPPPHQVAQIPQPPRSSSRRHTLSGDVKYAQHPHRPTPYSHLPPISLSAPPTPAAPTILQPSPSHRVPAVNAAASSRKSSAGAGHSWSHAPSFPPHPREPEPSPTRTPPPNAGRGRSDTGEQLQLPSLARRHTQSDHRTPPTRRGSDAGTGMGRRGRGEVW